MHPVVTKQGFEELSSQWETILPQCSTNTVFVTPYWQQAWWQEFGNGADLCLISVQMPNQAQGIAPLMVKDGTISFLGDTDLFDYHDFLVPKGYEEGFYKTLMNYLDSTSWRAIDLRSVPCGSPALEHLAALAKERGYRLEVRKEDVTLVTDLPRSWDEHLASLSKKDRHELRRKMRRLESHGKVRQYALTDLEPLSNSLGDFFRLLRASRQDKAQFLTPERERFFRRVALELAERGQLRLYFLELDGLNVASAMCFDYHDSVLLYNSGFDPAYSWLSVGLINKALCLKDAIERGKRFFDFLRGSESYKYDLGGKDRGLYQIVITR